MALYYLTNNQFNPHAKDSALDSMCDFPDKYIKFPKWPCVLNCYSERPSVFATDEDMNGSKYVYLTFIIFHHYDNIIYCYLNIHLLTEHGKICSL